MQIFRSDELFYYFGGYQKILRWIDYPSVQNNP